MSYPCGRHTLNGDPCVIDHEHFPSAPHTTAWGIQFKTEDEHLKPSPPIVVIIEIPEHDPDYYAVGAVTVDYVSAYPATAWATGEVREGEYADFPTKMRTAAESYDALDVPGAKEAAAAYRSLAEQFEEVHADTLAKLRESERELDFTDEDEEEDS